MWKCRVAPSLGGLEGTPEEVWGIETWDKDDLIVGGDNVFFGLYGLNDFHTLWRQDRSKGQLAVLWAGSDIRHLQDGYWLEDGGGLTVLDDIPHWINKYCANYCENEVEQDALRKLGINAEIVPSFMGNVDDFKPCFKPNKVYPKVYTSVSGNDFDLYGWDKIVALADANPNIEFHFYGNTERYEGPTNCIFHGRVPKEQMNKEIKDMQGCIRAVEFDGFSEIVAKAYLYEQYPVSAIPYPHSIPLHSIRELRWKEEPNTEGRKWLLENVNKYPWNINENNK